MSFFSRFVQHSVKGQKNFERARSAEEREEYAKAKEFFELSVDAYDHYLAQQRDKGKQPFPSHLVMAGIGYVRLGRNEDALSVLDECIRRKEIPDAYLHAGYAAAKLGRKDSAIAYWEAYPAWVEQPVIHEALREVLNSLRQDQSSLDDACLVMAQAIHRQDKDNAKLRKGTPDQHTIPANRGY
ncbi:MAG: hypothetical protein CL942_06365 [Desulfovibrio sp.]|nr:hypothetical protein [Desulfovibrio sp.]|tara:strand:+ start:72426 stop:72977 length:552 start_codon:yes stop_codon:yes gene_type:complete